MTERTAMIFGSGGHARVIASLLGPRRVRFVVEQDPGPDDVLETDLFAAGPDPSADYFIGIGDNAIRRRQFDRLVGLGLALPNCVAPNAWIAADTVLGQGVFVGMGAIVGAGAVIGDNVIINTLSSVDHDCVIGDDSQITCAVTLAGRVTVGRGSFLGVRAAVIPRVVIGEAAYVMAGALVTRDVPAHTIVGGSPARIARQAVRQGQS